jgi:hypothetical protein
MLEVESGTAKFQAILVTTSAGGDDFKMRMVLVLEDSQWLDSASWRLIEWILGSLSSLLLIVCVRIHGRRARRGDLNEKPG